MKHHICCQHNADQKKPQTDQKLKPSERSSGRKASQSFDVIHQILIKY